jgi:hypothetical protein
VVWDFAEAKKRLVDVFSRALKEGPQRITWQQETVIVLSEHEYTKLVGHREDFKRFLLRKNPTLDGLDLTRDRSPMRDWQGKISRDRDST